MEKPDYLELDGKQLQILLTIHEAGSLSGAAKRLDMNQSTVSYWLDLLRKRLDDPLFVRAGQGVQATETALRILPKARQILNEMRALYDQELYDPAEDNGVLHIACNEIESDLIVAPVFQLATQLAPKLRIIVTQTGSGFQLAERLQNGALDLAIFTNTIEPRDGIIQRRLHTFKDLVFHDANHPIAHKDLQEYANRPHARVAMGPDNSFRLDRKLAALGVTRHLSLQAGNFETLVRLIRGTNVIATLPEPLKHCSFCNLSNSPLPWESEKMDVMLYWHALNSRSARHRFWRDKLAEQAQMIKI